MPRNVYADAEVMIRERLLARPKARGRGRSAAFVENATRVGISILRKHGPYGARIFSACRELLKKLFGFTCRTILEALEQIGLVKNLTRPGDDLTGEKKKRARKWRSPECAALQFEIGVDFALLFLAAKPRLQLGQGVVGKEDSKGSVFSGLIVPTRTWDRKRPEIRLPSRAAVKRAAGATLEALQRLPLPALSPGALATLRRPAGFYGR